MGMYTEFRFHAKLRPDTPETVIETLKELINFNNPILNDHEFFSTQRKSMLFCGTDCITDTESPELQKFSYGYFLKIHSSFKNYDGEIKKFCDWISTWIYETDHSVIGYHQYEETTKPTKLVFCDGKIVEIESEVN
ncbi:MAG TPA: hypothetical protein VFM18_05430 [Methanosarcina sp.]|nr:hypothetical protein [Methanosarcina sp.]